MRSTFVVPGGLLEEFTDDERLEEMPKFSEGGGVAALQLLRVDAHQMGGEPAVDEMQFGRLGSSCPEGSAPRREFADKEQCFQETDVVVRGALFESDCGTGFGDVQELSGLAGEAIEELRQLVDLPDVGDAVASTGRPPASKRRPGLWSVVVSDRKHRLGGVKTPDLLAAMARHSGTQPRAGLRQTGKRGDGQRQDYWPMRLGSSMWPKGDPSGSQAAIAVGWKSWSRTMKAAPIIPPCPPSVERRIRRSRVAKGRDRW